MKEQKASKIQKQFWILNNMYPENGTYNLFSVFELHGEIQTEILQKAIGIVVNRHEALRSQFLLNKKDVYACVFDELNVAINECKIDEDFDVNHIHERIVEEVNKPFDLSNAPLFRFSIFHFNQVSVLTLVFHHIIIDVRSEGVFSKELGLAYNSLIKNEEPRFNDDVVQYSEYVNEVSQWYLSEEYNDKLKKFGYDYPNSNQEIKLPNDITNKREAGSGTGIYFQLEEKISNQVSDFALDNDTNPYRVLLTAYSILLKSLSNQDSVTVGLPLTNRTRYTSKNAFGCFINALPLEISFDNESTGIDILNQIKSKLKENLNRQEVPFLDLVSNASGDSKSIQNPYFQTGFAFKPPMQLSLDGIKAFPIKVIKDGSTVDLFFYFWEEGNHFAGYVEYSTNLFSEEIIKSWIGNFKKVLYNLFESPLASISKLNVLTETNVDTWRSFNKTNQSYSSNKCLHHIFEDQAEKTPESQALLWENNSMSYGELNKKANRLAHILIEKNIKPGNIIAFSLERCPELIIAILAIHKVGGCYLPIDTKMPLSRANVIIQDAKPVCLLTKQATDKNRGINDISKIFLDNLFIEEVDSRDTNLGLSLSSNNLAYIIYTSGSTGKPKGVKIEHRSVVNQLEWIQNKYELDNTDTHILKTPVTFDVSVWELFWWFFNGSRLLLLPPEGEKQPETIIKEVKDKKVTVINFVTSMMSSFLTYVEQMEVVDKLSSLRLVVQAGEALSPKVVRLFNRLRTFHFNPILLNAYGPTEATVVVTYYECPSQGSVNKVYIGKPVFNTQLYIVNKHNEIQAPGVAGELLILGDCLSEGYINSEKLNSEKFIQINDLNGDARRAYKTGDLAYLDKNSELYFMGRIDNQVKVRGYRIELGEIESRVLEYPATTNCAVIVKDPSGTNPQLVGYITVKDKRSKLINELKEFLVEKLPDYMIPVHFVVLEEMPLTTSGKIDRKKLPTISLIQENEEEVSDDHIQNILIGIYKNILEVDKVGIKSNFFDLGGTSLLAPLIVIKLKKEYDIDIKTLNIFEYPTIEALSKFISDKKKPHNSEIKKVEVKTSSKQKSGHDIAIIGMSGCFPGANDLDEFWDNIVKGKVSVSRFTREQLEAKGVSEDLLDNPNYVYANGIIDRGDMFDSSFFGVTPREADFMDPQHRLFLEVCYEALENGGYVSGNEPLNVGVFAGSGMSNYLIKALLQHPAALRDIGEFQTMVNSDKDFLTTRVSYKLNLTGPSYDIQTACSTSLVALHTACQNLLNNECEMALAGGVYIHTPRGHGYMFKSGGILSPTGYCKPFDKDADGTILGEGAGVVLLKRLDNAIKDKDNILAIIKSTATNNDGANKVGYMAPSVDGQSDVIRKAQEKGNIPSESISYIETHGTGTKLGDPIEISSLRKVFSNSEKHCALGAVKANIGHLDAAAGITGVIKTVLALKNKTIPPLAHFSDYNPNLEIEESPFYVPKIAKDWINKDYPLRAGISGFGIGGTNAHCILEEYPEEKLPLNNSNKIHLLPVSVKNMESLAIQSDNLLRIVENKKVSISNASYTLQNFRNVFKHRELHFRKSNSEEVYASVKGSQAFDNLQFAFMFTGQGSQYANMGKGLYQEFSVFRSVIDEANEILYAECGMQLLNILFEEQDVKLINETNYAQPLIVAVQYGLVKLLEYFGIKPDILIGHSIGELTAACVAGVFSFKDVLRMSSYRGSLMHQQVRGSMLSVNLSSEELNKHLNDNIEISLINAPNACVVSGSDNDILLFKDYLKEELPSVRASILKTSHAFHSKSMVPAIDPFKEFVANIPCNTIQVPFISNVSGILITDQEASSPQYWANHIRNVVDFNSGVNALLEDDSICFEIGPGNMLTSLLSLQNTDSKYKSIPTMRSPQKNASDVQVFLSAIGQYWVNGGAIDWAVMHDENARKVSLPTYAFNRTRHWVDTKKYFSYDVTQDNIIDEDILPTENEGQIDRSNLEQDYMPPVNELQIRLIRIWENVLGVNNVGLMDDFFDLGGHSLLASQLINKVNEELNINLPIETLFNYPTIDDLEKEVNQKIESHETSISYEKLDSNTKLPVSDEQLRLWILSQFDKSPAYNIPLTYKLSGSLNRKAFTEALREVIDRNEVLKSNVWVEGVSPYIHINKEKEYNINYLDISNENRSEQRSIVCDKIKEVVQKVFDLEKDILYRIYLFKISDNETIFHMTVNHIVFDGWSWGIFSKQLHQLYTNKTTQDYKELEETENQYYDYAGWQQKQDKDKLYEKSLGYWTDKLKGHPVELSLPKDFDRKPRNSGLGYRCYFAVPDNVSSKIRAVCKDNGVTEFTSYISVFSLLLHQYGGDTDICIGISAANRPNAILERIIGFFVNTLVLRFNISPEEPFVDFMKRNKTMVIEALDNQGLSFDKLVSVLKPERRMNINPVFQVMFSWLSTPRLPKESVQFGIEHYPIEEGVSPMDVTVYLGENEGKIDGEIEFNADIFSRNTVESFTKNYLKLLEVIANRTQEQINKLRY